MSRQTWLVLIGAVGLFASSCASTPSPLPAPVTPSSSALPSLAGTSASASAGILPTIAQTPACGLLYDSEVADELGVSIESNQELPATTDSSGWLTDCLYWRHQFQDEAPLELAVGAGARYVAVYQSLAGQPDVSSLPGVGDEAMMRMSSIDGLDQPVGTLYARVGDAVVSLSLGIVDVTDGGGLVQAGDAATQAQILLDLARIAVGRLTVPPTPAPSTCALLSANDAAAIIGVPLAAAQDVDEHDLLGPACHYVGADNRLAFLVAVNQQPAAGVHFGSCQQGGQMVLGLGDAAVIGRGDCAALVVDLLPLQPVVLVRSGSTVVTIAGATANGSADALVEVARRLLTGLGLNSGSTPAPVASLALSHACSLASDHEVGAIINEPITSIYERDPALNAGISECEYHSGDGSFVPVDVKLMNGPDALAKWSAYQGIEKGNKVPVAGLGDAALSEQFPGYEDQPTLVNIYVLSGASVLEIDMGASRQSADYLSYLAPGTPDQQLDMLQQLARLILPRLTDQSAAQ